MEYIPHAPFSFVFIYLLQKQLYAVGQTSNYQREQQIRLEVIFHTIYLVSGTRNIRNKAPRI